MNKKDEMVRSKLSIDRGIPIGTRFKVTARYTVQISEARSISCVRVRTYLRSASHVLHFGLGEFKRLFEPMPESDTGG